MCETTRQATEREREKARFNLCANVMLSSKCLGVQKNVYYIKMQTDEANQNPKYFAHNTPNECVFVCCERTQMRIICRSHSFEQANEKCEKKTFYFLLS